MDISTWLKLATKQLKDIGITSARLDAELLLAETLRKPRTYLHAHLDEDIDPRRIDIAVPSPSGSGLVMWYASAVAP